MLVIQNEVRTNICTNNGWQLNVCSCVLGFVQDEESGVLVDKTVPGAAAVNQKGKWDYLIGVGLACFIGLLNGSLSGKSLEGRCRECLPCA